MLLLDDAHAAEGYVAGPWSLEINRDEASAYEDVLSVGASTSRMIHLRQAAQAAHDDAGHFDFADVLPAAVD